MAIANKNVRLVGVVALSAALLTYALPAHAAAVPGQPPTPTSTAVLATATTLNAGDFLSDAEIQALPMVGAQWDHLKAAADSTWGVATMTNQDSTVQNVTLAGALVYARTGDARYRTKVIEKVKQVAVAGPLISLGIFRQLGSYVRAADLVGMPRTTVVASGETWGHWTTRMVTDTVGDHVKYNSVDHGALAPHNYGAYARDAYVALAVYNGDQVRLARGYAITARWLGDLSQPNPFVKPTTEGMSAGWYAATGFDTKAAANYLAVQGVINPANAGSVKAGINVEDASRGGAPPTVDGLGLNYQTGSLEAVVSTAIMLARHGYPGIWQVGNQAIRRNAVRINVDCKADTTWNHLFWNVPHVINAVYGASIPERSTRDGRSLGFTDWLTLNAAWPAR
jgi:hypothetical protein